MAVPSAGESFPQIPPPQLVYVLLQTILILKQIYKSAHSPKYYTIPAPHLPGIYKILYLRYEGQQFYSLVIQATIQRMQFLVFLNINSAVDFLGVLLKLGGCLYRYRKCCKMSSSFFLLVSFFFNALLRVSTKRSACALKIHLSESLKFPGRKLSTIV